MADSAAPKTEIGTAGGNAGVNGAAAALMDPNTDVKALQFPMSIRTFDAMYRDAQLYALFNGLTLPVRARKWAIITNGASDEATEDVARDLALPIATQNPDGSYTVDVTAPRGRTRGRFSHDDHLRHALIALRMGFYFSEQVGDIEEGSFKWRLRKLAPRLPGTISEVVAAKDGGLVSIKQNGTNSARRGGTQSSSLAFGATEIPVSQLVAYVWDKEGGNWYGRSMFVPCYRPWLIKDREVRIDAVRHERNGAGIPIVEAPMGASAVEIARLDAMAQRYKVGEAAGGAIPAGAKFKLQGVDGATSDVISSLRYHDQQMSLVFHSEVRDLGKTATGSRALGDTFADMLVVAQDGIAKWYEQTTNEHVIEDYIDWNFGEDENAPLIVSWIEGDPAAAAAAEYNELLDQGVLNLDPEEEAAVRATRLARRPSADRPRIAAGGRPRARRTPRTQARSQTVDDDRIGHRDPFPHEVQAAVDYEALQQVWQDSTDDLVTEWDAIRSIQVDALVSQIEAAVDMGDMDRLAALSAPVLGAEVIEARMMTVLEDGLVAAREEAIAQGVTPDLVNVENFRPQVASRAQATAVLLARSISESAARQAIDRYGVGVLAGTEVGDAVRAHLEDLSDSYLNDQFGGALTQAQNTGRRAVMAQFAGSATYYASELLDLNTCTHCGAVDGKEYSSLAEAEREYPTGGNAECLGGPRCRGTIVAVYEAETPPTVQE